MTYTSYTLTAPYVVLLFSPINGVVTEVHTDNRMKLRSYVYPDPIYIKGIVPSLKVGSSLTLGAILGESQGSNIQLIVYLPNSFSSDTIFKNMWQRKQ
jgi:hypothetical protein